jgi:transposase
MYLIRIEVSSFSPGGGREEHLQKKYTVELTPSERQELEALTCKGTASARRIKRALILLAADEGETDDVVAARVRAHYTTVGRIRQRFAEEGMEAALSERPRPGKAPVLDGPQEAHLLALASTPAPTGYAEWTMRLLADRLVQLDLVEAVSHQTVWRVLKKGMSNPGSTSSGAWPR